MHLYQHFKENEHPFVDRIIDWMNNVNNNYTIYVTEFLNPRERQMITEVIGSKNEMINFSFFGGVDQAERQRSVIAPYFVDIEEKDFELVAIEANYAQKFLTIEHRDVLGAFTSLGIDRKMVGEIIVSDGKIQIISAAEFTDYLIQQLTKIKNTNVSFKKIDMKQLLPQMENWKYEHYTVSSLRLDVMIKTVYKIPRKKAVQLIESERVKLNYTNETDLTRQLSEGDLLSVRGFGRIKVVDFHENRTKKNKIRITTAKLL